MSNDPKGRAWMEVDASALRRNLARIRASVGDDPGLVPMVKADAYGLGMLQAAAALEADDPWGLGVAAVSEGLALRAAGSTRRIVVFSPTPPGELETALEARLRPTVSDVATLERLADAARRGRRPVFHLEIDTGMGRAGLDPRAVDRWEPALRAAVEAGARWEGVYTHLHSADESEASVREQVHRFHGVLDQIAVPDEVLRHVLNSPGALRTPEFSADLVRPGIYLYGGSVGPGMEPPETVASVRARVVHVRDAEPGDTLGYGVTHVAETPERWATVAIGYGDGLPRALSNVGHALVGGRRVPIVGRISMDVTVVDITGLPSVIPGEVVTFLGRDGNEIITADEVAERVGTISYEVLTGFTPRLPRIWEAPVGP